MAKKYDWRTNAEIISGGYTGEETGVIPEDTGWRTTDSMTGSATAEYYFRDSDTGENANSSRVVVSISESWTASISNKNYLTVTLKTTIAGIRRDDLRGTVGSMSIGRSMYIRRQEDGNILWQTINDPINTAHTILGSPIVLDDYTFVLAPGENLTRSSIYFRSNTQGHDGDVPPSIYVDLMWLGTQFRNPLPANYRPGATLLANEKHWPVTDGVWVSHNDTNGACHVLSDVNNLHWHECRTIGYPDGQGDPPLLLRADNDSSWYNMAELGKYVRP